MTIGNQGYGGIVLAGSCTPESFSNMMRLHNKDYRKATYLRVKAGTVLHIRGVNYLDHNIVDLAFKRNDFQKRIAATARAFDHFLKFSGLRLANSIQLSCVLIRAQESEYTISIYPRNFDLLLNLTPLDVLVISITEIKNKILGSKEKNWIPPYGLTIAIQDYENTQHAQESSEYLHFKPQDIQETENLLRAQVYGTSEEVPVYFTGHDLQIRKTVGIRPTSGYIVFDLVSNPSRAKPVPPQLDWSDCSLTIPDFSRRDLVRFCGGDDLEDEPKSQPCNEYTPHTLPQPTPCTSDYSGPLFDESPDEGLPYIAHDLLDTEAPPYPFLPLDEEDF